MYYKFAPSRPGWLQGRVWQSRYALVNAVPLLRILNVLFNLIVTLGHGEVDHGGHRMFEPERSTVQQQLADPHVPRSHGSHQRRGMLVLD
jgi:hypothetical protein